MLSPIEILNQRLTQVIFENNVNLRNLLVYARLKNGSLIKKKLNFNEVSIIQCTLKFIFCKMQHF